MKRLFVFLKPKRTWHDFNRFERKMWVQLFDRKKAELKKQIKDNVQCCRLAKRYADWQMRAMG
ncbi:hypothetical protein [Alteribacillus bidgolensis]|uniref:hypothetical protein n=1 Tax=Alteribacillus bidgolensis TaxID=930129 RepID=UPI000B875504|nr:hypothetical protein [Alteribacillus bidgolensis]